MLAKLSAKLPPFVIHTLRYLREKQRFVRLLTAVMALVTIVVIGQLSYSNRDLLFSLELRPVWLIPTAVFIALELMLGAIGWHLLVYKTAHLNALQHNVKVWWSSNLARRIPGGIWYIASRAAMYGDYPVNKRTISATSVLELVVILTSGLIIVLTTSPFWVITREELLNSYDWVLVGLIPFGLGLIHPRFIAWVWQKLDKNTAVPTLHWPETLALLAYYALIWLLAGPMVYSIINILYPLSLIHLPSIIGMWALANIIATISAFTIGGLGVRELSLGILLAFIIPTPLAIIVVILVRIFWLIGEIITGLFSLLLK